MPKTVEALWKIELLYGKHPSYTERPEWVAVGMMGKLLIRDDGTCRENGYCIERYFFFCVCKTALQRAQVNQSIEQSSKMLLLKDVKRKIFELVTEKIFYKINQKTSLCI
ncbi:hypothetical protein MHI48_18045 [Paenibacillus sp. FSL H7-0942]|uniref:hypothetical protein n=1 Tax=Paenibacillus sp. FSL H7-0942 TaxID=2921444 RepID=UPI0003E298C9|nr:hypothetical protein C170_20295 [Paenibacillus sp. FSL H7-689]OMF01402.1 hypothetical protein BK124_01635 [Paenibacillus amylolyticus]OMF05505.1 hypothetical protein BK129_16135 [Paenibacillus amylolyticus]